MKRIAFVLWSAAIFSSAATAQILNGAGATFPYPVYARWFREFRASHPGINVNYESIGSGAGISQLTAGVVDFGASDMPMTEQQLAAAHTKILHFPTVIGGVVPIYNIGDGKVQLRFTPEILADIFLGKLTRWNDPRLREANPGVNLPAGPITPVHRFDASGTTFILTDYLSKTVPEWRERVGRGTSVKWPGGYAEKGSEGVSGRTKHLTGAIGYVELAYALQNGLPYGSIRNAAGVYIRADMKSVTAAAANTAMPEDFRVSITNAPRPDAWPISSFTWLLVPETISDSTRRKALTALLRWSLTQGQALCSSLGYAPLPAELVRKELRQLDSIH